MHRILVGAMVALALLLGAGTAGAGPDVGTWTGVLPVTLDGTLEIDVHPGDMENNAEGVAFGVFNSAGNDFTVELPAEFYAKAPNGGAVRITLGSRRDNLGFPVFAVTGLERL
jgi:hypothetical protein